MVTGFAVCQPHRNNQPAGFQLSPMPRTGRNYLPRVLLTKRLEGFRNLDWLTPGFSIVNATNRKTASVVQTVQKVELTRFVIHNRNRIINRLLFFAACLLAGVPLITLAMMCNLLHRQPRFSSIF